MVQARHFLLGAAFALLVPPRAFSQGGPPFRTDDPETPGNRQWEINLGFIGDRHRSEGSYATPNLDFNYGLGDRIQLKFELPFALQESRGSRGTVAGGLGNSLLGVKWRFYQHQPQARSTGSKIQFSFSVYPQLSLNNPTRSVERGIVDPGPQLLLPLEVNASIGPVKFVAEGGYTFATDTAPNSWLAGLMVGHEFQYGELYVEFHDQGDISGPGKETTLGIGGRRPIGHDKKLLLMSMAGRSLRTASVANDQPQWIAYVGLQLQIGRHR